MARNNLPLCLHKYNLQQKSLTKMRSSTSLLGRVLLWIASEMLEI